MRSNFLKCQMIVNYQSMDFGIKGYLRGKIAICDDIIDDLNNILIKYNKKAIVSNLKENNMAGFVSKQPNGLYCRFSTVTDCPTAWNMTREDYINMKMQEAKRRR